MSAEPVVARGPVAWMARNPVAANLMMVVILVAGLLGLKRARQEVFPQFDLDLISITVPYPGASPTDVEQGIVLAVEEAVRGLDGVKYVRSTASEGVGVVSVELMIEADPQEVLSDVKNAVDRVRTMPVDAESPVVQLLSRRSSVVTLIVAGDHPDATLHALGEEARRRVIAAGVTQVELFGVRPLEIAIEIDRATLQSLGLDLDAVAAQVAAASVELPGGAVKTDGGEILVRVDDRRVDADGFRDIVLRGTRGGAQVRLGDVATIRDGYADTDAATYFGGQPAVEVVAYRVGAETPISVADTVREVRDALDEEWPDSVTLGIANDDSINFRGRIDLLTRNAMTGLILVLVILALFLDIKLAFWVAWGIPVSFLGAFALLPATGVSINMVSMFAFIITLGIVVDDAIIIGENTYTKMREGMPAEEAAMAGAQEMTTAITFAILSTIAAFSPLFFIPGFLGKIFNLIPTVVALVLTFSMIEGFFVLPAHLSHPPGAFVNVLMWPFRILLWPASRLQPIIEVWLDRFLEGPLHGLLHRLIRWRGVVMAFALGLLAVSFGAVKAGIVPFNFFPSLEGNSVSGSARLPYGTPVERTEAVRAAMEASLRDTIAALPEQGIVKGILTRVGEGPRGRGGASGETGSHVLSIDVELVPSEDRETSASAIAAAWRTALPALAGVDSLKISAATGPGSGSALDAQLSHPDPAVLGEASAVLADSMNSYPDLTNVDNTFASGKVQFDFKLLPEARAVGITSRDVGRQLRAAFFGAEAVREQRGRNELKVMVRLPEAERRSEFDLEQFEVRAPDGSTVPLAGVARFERGRSPTSIQREGGQRIVNVRADLAQGAASPRLVTEDLSATVLPELVSRFPGLTWEFVGRRRDQAESMASLGGNFIVALFVIYALVAIPFRSYTQPIIVLSAIPFGIVGAVAGHVAMGYPLTMISIMGIVALAGVVVNDSLVLIQAVNGYRALGFEPIDAVVTAAKRRFRPILLTSLTTFAGLAPMILETSVQARFLIPMAISLGFGILFATFIVLLIVPCLYVSLEWLQARLLGEDGDAVVHDNELDYAAP